MFSRTLKLSPLRCRISPAPSTPFQSRSAYVRFGPPRGGSNNYQRFNRRPTLGEMWESPRFRKIAGGTAVGGVTFYAYNTEVVPVSGRRRFNIVSVENEAKMAVQMYEETIAQFEGRILPTNHHLTRRVRKILDRLIPASGLQDLEWEVFVIKDDSMKNAFVIPGGKVFVFSGILPICGDDDGLAAVMSHEIAHTVAHHAAERLSKSFIALAAVLVAGIAIGDPDMVGRMGRILIDLVYLRPGSRKQEAEADYIGLMMMAQACYRPEKAVTLWERMEAAEEFSMPQFLSTHPSNVKRIQNIQQWLPEAKVKSEMSDCSGTPAVIDEFVKVFEYPKW
ncbi:peptidase family M48-domain-containing protein [Tricharina praecox]|uniref:peptidase family M48-domain-containing protein n=1 Tax=Tricharina praecox TaxID=43433 RepID=UPI00221FC8FF|nr:peptidase family M48-domain-containing protein [Tricharina praecox]KAI5849044.1 peptidase family M48-domain-containing protein [Tricharina praecox]